MAEGLDAQLSSVVEEPAADHYTPSLVDRFADWVDRLPCPAWLFYLLLGSALLLLLSAIKWSDGVIPFGGFSLFFVAQAFLVPYIIAGLHYLDKLAAEDLENFRPALVGSDQQYRDLRRRLTTLPALPTLVAAALGIVYGLLPFTQWKPNEVVLLKLASSPLASVVEEILFLLGWAAAGMFVYHRQHPSIARGELYLHHVHPHRPL